MNAVYNKSKEAFEPARMVVCPRCKGFGAVHGDDDRCTLCKGYGKLWMSNSGWVRFKHGRTEDCRLW